jgi:hypothetical protein
VGGRVAATPERGADVIGQAAGDFAEAGARHQAQQSAPAAATPSRSRCRPASRAGGRLRIPGKGAPAPGGRRRRRPLPRTRGAADPHLRRTATTSSWTCPSRSRGGRWARRSRSRPSRAR